MTTYALVIVALLLFTPAGVSAMAAPRPPDPVAPENLPALSADAVVVVRDLELEVHCRTRRQAMRCRVRMRFEAYAPAGAVLDLPVAAEWRVNDLAVSGAVEIPPGRAVEVHMARRFVVRERRGQGLYLIAEPMFVRHALFGEFHHTSRGSGSEGMLLFRGSQWQLEGSATVHAARSRRAQIHVNDMPMPESVSARLSAMPRHIRLVLEAPRPTPRVLRRGGPVFMLGTGRDGLRARAGYEAGLGQFGFLQFLVESDFKRALGAAVMLEAALPSPLYLIPSLSAGIGLRVEARDDPHVALRFALGAGVVGMQLVASLDWAPHRRRVEPALLGRISF